MLLRRYGTTIQTVEPDFDPRALTEIGFRRDRKHSFSAEEFEAGFEKQGELEIAAESHAAVQMEAEQELLDRVRGRLDAAIDELAEGHVLLVESEAGNDWPKTREKRENVIVEGENRFHFHWWVEPPLRVGIYRPRA